MGLYRLLMAQAFRHAVESRTVLNLSAGASGFKRLRGDDMPAIEYSAVHARRHPARTAELSACCRPSPAAWGLP